LALTCPSCGISLPRGARFWYRCGAAVAAEAGAPARSTSPESYTPKHIAENILVLRAGSSSITLGHPKARRRCVSRRRARVGYFLFKINAAGYGVAPS
jgi:hypothetical protein